MSHELRGEHPGQLTSADTGSQEPAHQNCRCPRCAPERYRAIPANQELTVSEPSKPGQEAPTLGICGLFDGLHEDCGSPDWRPASAQSVAPPDIREVIGYNTVDFNGQPMTQSQARRAAAVEQPAPREAPEPFAAENWRMWEEMTKQAQAVASKALKKLEAAESLVEQLREQAVEACVDMAERYDADIEGCDGDELERYGEGITCSFRLAYIIKYGKRPPKGDAWSAEFAEMVKTIRKRAAPAGGA